MWFTDMMNGPYAPFLWAFFLLLLLNDGFKWASFLPTETHYSGMKVKGCLAYEREWCWLFFLICGEPWKHCGTHQKHIIYKKESIHLKGPEEIQILKIYPGTLQTKAMRKFYTWKLIEHSEDLSAVSQISLWNRIVAYVKIIGQTRRIFIIT